MIHFFLMKVLWILLVTDLPWISKNLCHGAHIWNPCFAQPTFSGHDSLI